ncbi:MAG: MBL fold metallo-hydrolase [Microbispora sp.]|nr:MBL fold metallo-hydrolase [Microbispora sp.]
MSASPSRHHSSLHALPISGESFLLCRGRYTVLVDGGYKRNQIATVLQDHFPDRKHIDIVVCTHADQDHAGGLPDLLRAQDFTFGQVWLPGRWRDVLPELLKDPRGFVRGLVRELDSLGEQYSGSEYGDLDEEQFAEVLSDRVRQERARVADVPPERPRPSADLARDISRDRIDGDYGVVDLGTTEPLDEPPWFAKLKRQAHHIESDEVAEDVFKSARGSIRYRRDRPNRPVSVAVATYWLGLMETAEAIRKIGKAAIDRGLRVRWFDYVAYSKTGVPAGGIPGFLVPINAVEQQAPEQLELSYLARLSPTNEASLAFFAPATRRAPGVLFCGDSPLGDGPHYRNSFLDDRPRPWGPVVVTAPHHGAETNRIAYRHIYRWSDVAVLLRAGGKKRHPGRTFKRLQCSVKLCANCPERNKAPVLAGVEGTCARPFWPPLFVRGLRCACG